MFVQHISIDCNLSYISKYIGLSVLQLKDIVNEKGHKEFII